MANKITKKLKRMGESGLFHDSRADVRLIAKYCNSLVDKINELIDEIETIKKDKP